jgi:DNA-binding winged helix-turn-helix (wHTH) protein
MAVPQLRHEVWRIPGCTEACRAIRVIQPGLLGRAEIVQHDPGSHADWGRLNSSPLGEAVVWTGALVIDRLRRTVYVEGREVSLTAREWAILDYLAEHVGRWCSSTEILVACWGSEWAYGGHMFRVNLSRLRYRLGACAPLLENAHGHGYRLRADSPTENAPIPARPRLWAKAWDRCRDCATTERRHESHGRCAACAKRHRRAGGA